MEYLILIGIALGLIIFSKLFLSSNKTFTPPKSQVLSSKEVTNKKTFSSTQKKPSRKQSHEEWLRERWELADKQVETGQGDIFPEWFFDKATQRQLEKLDELGVGVDKKAILKGQASDLIGLHYDPDDKEIEILKFFKIPTRSLKQSQAKHEIALLFKNQENVTRWKNRPLTPNQKDFFEFFGIEPEKGLTSEAAEKTIDEYLEKVEEEDKYKYEEWNAYETLLDELTDKEFLEDYEIKKPSKSLIKKALTELRKAGKSYDQMLENEDEVIDKLIELKPDILKKVTAI